MPVVNGDEEILRIGISYHMCRLNDMPFDAQMVTNDAFHKIPVEPKELFFDVNRVKKVVEPEKLVLEIRAKHRPNDMLLFVKDLIGKTIGLNLNTDYKVEEVKVLIQQTEGWAPAVQRLLYAGKQMSDEKTLQDYDVNDRSMLHIVLSLQGGGCVAYQMYAECFHPRHNCDFRRALVDRKPFSRGGSLYVRPLGSMRYAIKVLNKFEDNYWLGVNRSGGARVSAPNEWPVAYHGTTDPRAAEIVRSGGLDLAKGVHFTYGYGIYCTPDPQTALAYASTYHYDGRTYKLIIQVRVDPARRHIVPKSVHGCAHLDDYWIATENDAIRAYGICVFPC